MNGFFQRGKFGMCLFLYRETGMRIYRLGEGPFIFSIRARFNQFVKIYEIRGQRFLAMQFGKIKYSIIVG